LILWISPFRVLVRLQLHALQQLIDLIQLRLQLRRRLFLLLAQAFDLRDLGFGISGS
jgi:hypothetical protein